MKKLILMFGLVAAAFLTHADYLVWQITSEDTARIASYDYIMLNYDDGQGNKGTLEEIYAPNSGVMEGSVTTDLTTIADGTKYSIFVEFMNYQSDKDVWSQVGVSSTQMTYQSGADNQAYIVVSDSIPTKAPANITPWHGGTVDVPEPTSGMMVLVGLSLLALKRRKI